MFGQGSLVILLPWGVCTCSFIGYVNKDKSPYAAGVVILSLRAARGVT